MPALASLFLVELVLLNVMIYGPDSDTGLVIVVALAVLVLAIGMLLLATIALFNDPAQSRPPHLREQRGAVGEWRDGRRRRRSGDPAESR